MPTTPNIVKARVVMTGRLGKGGFVMDNIDAADPESEVYRQIKSITDKGQMTDEDRQRKDRLAYQGALYLNDAKTGLVLPHRCVKRSLRSGAYLVGGVSLSGKIDAGVEGDSVTHPMLYAAAPDDRNAPEPIKMYDDQRYRLRMMVNKNPTGKKAMVASVRPILPVWSVELTLTVFNEIVSWEQFVRTLQTTGESVGVGNARRLGYGRFDVNITRI